MSSGGPEGLVIDVGPVQELVDGQQGPSAVGWSEGTEVWSNSDRPRPIASITKVVTALVCLEQQPIAAGTDGAVHTWTEADAARANAYAEQGGVTFPIPVGTRVTAKQMLTMMLLPSANDFAAAYAVSVFGSEDAFAAAAQTWAAKNGLTSLQIFEPTGMDEYNVSTAADLVRLGRLAMANPTVSEITRLPSANMPWGIGTVKSSNPLLRKGNGILGIKTGSTSAAGYALLSAEHQDVDGRDMIRFSAVLQRETTDERRDSSWALLDGMGKLAVTQEYVQKDQVVGSARTIDGAKIDLLATKTVSAGLVPGEQASIAAKPGTIHVGKAGQRAGTAHLRSPAGSTEIPIVTKQAIEDPGLWWRMTHPRELFGK
nr:hypothetical protein [Leucobacter edaphi]